VDLIHKNLQFLYGENDGQQTFEALQNLLAKEKKEFPQAKQQSLKNYFSEKDTVLITYADSFTQKGELPLKTLEQFLAEQLKDTFNTIHILPFYPYSSDRGFSTTDFSKVKKEFGSWEDIKKIGKDFSLMADLVINHVSAQSHWFQKFLAGDPKYQEYFTSFTREELTDDVVNDLQKVFRPRALPLLTEFETKEGKRFVWTTISADQIDLNYQNPQVLVEMIQVMLLLLHQGVRLFRMDAITFIWKELGTNCVHLPQGHAILQIFRAVLNEVCPSALLVTETNVPHKDNISYFGNGTDEAQMVYNFALPPLTLHAFYTGDVSYICEWAKTLTPPSQETTFFNFLACHDGIGILGARGILPDEEIDKIFRHIKDHGAKLSYRRLPSGESSVYEMCTTWWSALNKKDEDFDLALRKFITSHAIAFALAGVPAVYYLSLFGKENDEKMWRITQRNRDINRENLDYPLLSEQLAQEDSREKKVYDSLVSLIKLRTKTPGFHPNAKQTVLTLDKRIFALLRESAKGNVLALHNVSGEEVTVSYQEKQYILKPYSFLWESVV